MSKLTDRQRKELEALEALPDEAIDTRDIPEEREWRAGIVGKFYRPVKRSVTIRLDADVVAYFQQDGGKYQTRINQVLREHMERERKTA
jgi:uncharacterized protein (DUF4415 family)